MRLARASLRALRCKIVFVFSRDAVGAGARFGVAKRTKKRQTRGWIVPSSSRRRSMRSIRAVSRYSRLVGVLSVVAGGSRTSRRATAPIGKKLDRRNSRQKGRRRRRPSPRASPLSCPPPLRRVFCDGLLRRSWSSRGGDGRTSRESVAFALRAGLRRASDGTVPSLAAGSRLIPARPRMSEKKRNVPRRDPPSSRPERVSFSASFSSPSLASRPNALLFERAPSASSSSRPFLSWWSGYLIPSTAEC